MGLNELSYFAAITKLVKGSMKTFEKRLQPVMNRAVHKIEVPVKVIPVEGDYGESEDRIMFYYSIKALQNNDSQWSTLETRKLNRIYSSDVFGICPSKRTLALDESKYTEFTSDNWAVVSPMMDTITCAMQSLSKKGIDWTIQNIMVEAEKLPKGTNLVGFGITVDQFYKSKSEDGLYNPVATAHACEATVASRAKFETIGYSTKKPKIDSAVEQYGIEVIEAYNRLFRTFFLEGWRLKIPTKLKTLNKVAEDIGLHDLIGTCVNLGVNSYSNTPYYYWGIVGGKESVYPVGLGVIEMNRDEIVTKNDFLQECFDLLVKGRTNN